ncbi:MAG: hypothetical protein J5705_04090 [Bacteroidaceae bacterium]|nr:hypothetical protein [Bacteroidaceae bacterium]
MRAVLKTVLAAAMIMFSLTASAQRSGRTKDPTINRGDGLEMSRSDLSKIRNQKQDKNSRKTNLYMFASSFSMLDSVIYVSDVHKVDSVMVNNKWFLKNRVAFEQQFMDRVSQESVYDLEEVMMPVIYYGEKEKKVLKQREKLIKRNGKSNRYALNTINDFIFVNPVEEAESETEQQ